MESTSTRTLGEAIAKGQLGRPLLVAERAAPTSSLHAARLTAATPGADEPYASRRDRSGRRGQARTHLCRRRLLTGLAGALVALAALSVHGAPASAFYWQSTGRVGATTGWTRANINYTSVGYGPNYRVITAPSFTVNRNGSVGTSDFQRYLTTFTLYKGTSINNMFVYNTFSYDNYFNPGQTSATFNGVVYDYSASRGNYYRWQVEILWFDVWGNHVGTLSVNSDRAGDFSCNAASCLTLNNGSVWVG